jgi:hypothetical protein
MKSKLKYPLPLLFVLTCAVIALAQTPNGIHGAFTGNLQLPSPFTFQFANHVNSDVANSTIAPASSAAWGTVAMAANTATVTFKTAFTVAPVCVGNYQTGVFAVKFAPTATTVVITNTGGGATDVIAYHCFGNPN